jgi:hypothetical protein
MLTPSIAPRIPLRAERNKLMDKQPLILQLTRAVRI